MTESLSVERGGAKRPPVSVHGRRKVRICRGPGCNNVLDNPRKMQYLSLQCSDKCRNAYHTARRAPKPKGTMNAASVKSSPILIRMYAALKDGEWHTVKELSITCDDYTAGTTISALRQNGLTIKRRKGEQYNEYRLFKKER